MLTLTGINKKYSINSFIVTFESITKNSPMFFIFEEQIILLNSFISFFLSRTLFIFQYIIVYFHCSFFISLKEENLRSFSLDEFGNSTGISHPIPLDEISNILPL